MTWRNRRRRKQSRIIRRVMRRAFETAAAELFRESYLSFYTTKRELKPLDVSGLILIEDFDYKQGIPSVPIWQPALDMLNQTELDERRLTVNEARPLPERGDRKEDRRGQGERDRGGDRHASRHSRH